MDLVQAVDTYPFDSISCNGRKIGLRDILNNNATPLSGFEASAYSFIQQWFSGTEIFVQITSGSTGVPKSIVITRNQMIASARLTQLALQLKSGDTSFVCLDPEYIAGKMMLVRSFVTGMNIIAADPSANPFLNIPMGVSIDFTALVPFQLYEILGSSEVSKLNLTKKILVGGAALNHEAQILLSKVNARIYATYGMTETVSHVALQAVNGPQASKYFTILPGVKIETDSRGCLVIEAPYLAEKIITNDLVEIKDHIHFKWIGRQDNIINTGGVKVIPEKIEGLINTFFAQRGIENKFLIVGMPDSTLGYKVTLLIEGEISEISVDIIKAGLSKILPKYEIPKEIYINVNFVLTKSGKINRSETAASWELAQSGP